MKLDNKGFAITGFLYSIFAIFLVILSLILISMTSSKLTLDKIKKDVKNKLDDPSTENNLYEKLFTYTGSVQSLNIPYSGWYLIELWGAQGADTSSKGAYVSGKVYLNEDENIYIYIGEGKHGNINSTAFNNGTSNNGGVNGGGATDIRIIGGAWNNLNSLVSRIMVASGSGSGLGNNNELLGAGGTLTGNNGGGANGGTQISSDSMSSFGVANGNCTGGGGYYPGSNAACGDGAGGGSSFISGYAGVNAITSSSSLTPTNNTNHYSGKYFIDGKMESGVNEGNGKAKIKYLSQLKSERINSNLNSVRYIKDCAAGSSYSGHVGWVELQAIKDGINVAKGKVVTGTEKDAVNGIYDKVVDGDISTDNYDGTTSSSGTYCITIDLGQNYDLDEIAVWHYWGDGRTYYSNVTSTSKNNIEWKQVISNNESETSNGKRVSAYSK